MLNRITFVLLTTFGLASVAHAQPAPQQPDPFMSMLPLILLIVIFYFLLIRPQMKRAKEHKQMVGGLSKGDEIITNGGIAGKIREVGENLILVEIADNVKVKVQKSAVASTLPKGSLETL